MSSFGLGFIPIIRKEQEMKKILVCFVAFMFASSLAFAQIRGKIAGQIIDKETGRPLVAANILVVGTNSGAASDREGYFQFDVPPGVYTVKATLLGYQEMKIENVRVSTNKTTRVNFQLSSEKPQVSQVTVVTQPSSDFHLSVNHISRTIMPHEEAQYLIEVFCEGTFVQPIQLSLVQLLKVQSYSQTTRSNNLFHSQLRLSSSQSYTQVRSRSGFSYSLEPSAVWKTSIVRLSIKAPDISEEYTKYLIEIKAETQTVSGSIVRYIRMWLFVVNPPPSKSMVTFAVSPDLPLANGVIQPIEGRVVPPKSGYIQLGLLHPDKTLQKLILSVDSQGCFDHNYVFRKRGQWKAAVVWAGSTRLPFYRNEPDSFQVASRIPKIAITTINPRSKTVGDMLEIVGQLVADTSQIQVRIDVDPPISKKTTLHAITDSTGRFQTLYRIQDSGLHHITAYLTGLPGSSAYIIEPVSANHSDGDNGNNGNDDGNDGNGGNGGDCNAMIGETNDYAIILVGGLNGLGHPDLEEQNKIACFLYQQLVNERGFDDDDILLLSETANVSSYCNSDFRSHEYQTRIESFLVGINNRNQSNLFIYLIGHKPDNYDKLEIWQENNNTPTYQPTFDELAGYFQNKPKVQQFENVVYFAAFDFSGKFLTELKRHSTDGGQERNYIATSNAGNRSVSSINWQYKEASFTGIFAQNIARDDDNDIKNAFYDTRYPYYRSIQDPWLDDNRIGSQTFYEWGSSCAYRSWSDNQLWDGSESENHHIGITPGTENVQPGEDHSDVTESPVGVLLSKSGKVIVSLDNPNDFPIKKFTAIIYHPQGSRTSPVQVPLTYDATSGAYLSRSVSFPDSGLYHIRILYKYLDGSKERYRTYVFKKYRHNISPDEDRGSLVFFDPHLNVGFNYLLNRNTGFFKEYKARSGAMIGLSLFSSRGRFLEFFGIGAASNFDKHWGLIMPVSLNLGRIVSCNAISNVWLYGGIGFEFDIRQHKFLTDDLKYSLGLKSRLYLALPK